MQAWRRVERELEHEGERNSVRVAQNLIGRRAAVRFGGIEHQGEIVTMIRTQCGWMVTLLGDDGRVVALDGNDEFPLMNVNVLGPAVQTTESIGRKK